MSNSGFEGFDYQSNYHLSEREEKNENWEQAKIWVIIGLFMALCLGLTIFMHSKELLLKYNGNSIVADYKYGDQLVVVQDNNGANYNIDISQTIISKQKDGKLTLYYRGSNVAGAKALTSNWFWVVMYAVWIPLFSLCVYLALKNLNQNKKIKHSRI